MQKKTIGIIGGIGPESTIDYYKSLIREFRNTTQSDEYPSILINSINMTKMLDFVSNSQFEQLVDFMLCEIIKLKEAGADYAVMASNTPHIVFNEIRAKSPIELISIVEVTGRYAMVKGYKKCGLFGTKFTMDGGFYQKEFQNKSLELVVPSNKEKDYIHYVYFNELVQGIFKPETKDKLVTIARRLLSDEQISALILGGTELPLVLEQIDMPEIPLINTSEIHIRKMIDFALN